MEGAAPALMILAAMILAAGAARYSQSRREVPPEMAMVVEPASEEDVHEPEVEWEEPAEEDAEVSPAEVRIEVNIPATEMTLLEGETELFRRRVAIGSGVYPTPPLTSFISRIEWNPWWYPPPYSDWAKDDKPTPPGPGNPLGLVKIPLSGDILFHGTNKEWTVGRPASHGCMRMKNSEVTALAWYLQSNFSDHSDPELRDKYKRNRGTTYVVRLNTRIPVRLVYRPVVARNGFLVFYPDHYNRMWGRKKAGVLGALLNHGVDISVIDDAKIESIAKSWPSRGTKIFVRDIILDSSPASLLDAPVCE